MIGNSLAPARRGGYGPLTSSQFCKNLRTQNGWGGVEPAKRGLGLALRGFRTFGASGNNPLPDATTVTAVGTT